MTFYNIISAVIFLGAFRELLRAFQGDDLAALSRASLVALLVFSDAIYTSWTVETRVQKYDPKLMSIDLINFMILSGTLVFLNPAETNILQLDMTKLSASLLSETRFWLLLCVYWLLIMLWTRLAGVYDEPKYPKWLIPF